jgi:hypothetical protein
MCFVYWLGANAPRRLGVVGSVLNEKREREISVESIRSYCSLVPSKGNLCLLYVIAVKLLFLGPRKLSILGNRPPSHHFSPNALNFRGTEPCTLPAQG